MVSTAHAQGAGHPRKLSDTAGLNGAQSHAIGSNYSIVIAGLTASSVVPECNRGSIGRHRLVIARQMFVSLTGVQLNKCIHAGLTKSSTTDDQPTRDSG